MPALHLKTNECRVGVVGLYNAGKTVLLTSLVNHLDHHDLRSRGVVFLQLRDVLRWWPDLAGARTRLRCALLRLRSFAVRLGDDRYALRRL